MSLDYPILPICQTAESFRNILSAMGPYRDSISLKKSPLLGLYTGSEAQLDLATVRYHALGAYAKSVYLVFSITFSYSGGSVVKLNCLSRSVAQSGHPLLALADKVQRVSNYLPTHNKICLQNYSGDYFCFFDLRISSFTRNISPPSRQMINHM